MAPLAAARVRGDLDRLAAAGTSVPEFARAAARLLAHTVPFDGFCLLTHDPLTSLPTSEVVENGLPPQATPRLLQIEMRGEDVNTFDTLRRSGRQAATLSGETGGDLDRSERHRELRAPHGFGDELRVVLVEDSTAWGALTLLRRSGHGLFKPSDTAVVAAVSDSLAGGLRRVARLATAAVPGIDRGGPGLVLLAPDDAVLELNSAAEVLLDELREPGGPDLPPIVTAVAGRARTADGDPCPPGGASARLHTPSTGWLLVRGSVLGTGPSAATAVVIESARPADLAGIVLEAHGLTHRERAVTRLVAQGLTTTAIGHTLTISAWTVQDHLKAIFAKLGVGSRGELVARMFVDPIAAQHQARAALPPRDRDRPGAGC
jgi:DNA-binding CsgD family transcriptional regulator